MKRFILLLVLFYPLYVAAQFQDDFSNNSFPHLPRWYGNVDAFGLNDDSLLKSKTISTTFISAINTLAFDVVWEFGIQLDFNPSTKNQLRIYLIADRDSLTKPLNGYFIQIGESGDTDRYQLYKQLGETFILIMSSPPKPRLDPLKVESRIRMTRDKAGNWKLYTAQNEERFILDAYGTDKDIDSSAFFGIQCIFTSSNSDKFGFDYVRIDTLRTIETPPTILSTTVLDSVSLQLDFSEKLDSISATSASHYTLGPGYGSPQSITITDSTVILSFVDALLTNDYTLNVRGIEGLTGNIMKDTAVIFHYETPETPSFSEKLKPDAIAETLFIDTFENDLSPLWNGQTEKFNVRNQVVEHRRDIMPPAYIHIPNTAIKNRMWEAGIEVNENLTSQNYVRIYLSAVNDSLSGSQKGYFLQIDGSKGNHHYKLYRQTSNNRKLLFKSEPVRDIGEKIRTRVRISCDLAGYWKVYADEYDHGEFKLLLNEMGDSSVRDTEHSASLYSGWMTRFSKTRINDYALHYFLIRELTEVPEDTIPPSILSVSVVDSMSVQVAFSETMDKLIAANIDHYRLDPDLRSPENISASDSTVILIFSQPLATNNYTLHIQQASDLNGNTMADTSINFHYEAPETPSLSEKLKPDAIGKTLFIDTFENDLSPLWNGQTEKFDVRDRVVEHKGDVTSPAYIHIPNTVIKNRMWEAGIEVNENLTSQNYVSIYLSAVNDSLSGSQKGYFLQIGGSKGNHHYKLYKQTSNNRKLLFKSEPVRDIGEKIRTRVRISCDLAGYWKVYADEYDHGEFKLLLNEMGDSSVRDTEHSASFYSGWMTRFSKTRINDYALHYFLIRELTEIPQDTIPPNILSVSVVDSMSVQVAFSEAVDSLTAAGIDHYSLDPNRVSPQNISVNDSIAILSFTDPLLTNNYTLHIQQISDKNGNVMTDTSFNFNYQKPYAAKPFDIIINEIMADPNPTQGLPAMEYIELRNLTDHDIDLQHWTYSSKTKDYLFDQDSIKANSHLLLYKASDSLLIEGFENSIGLSSWPSLINNGTTLTLKNEQGIVIDAVSYESSWYGDSQKNKGGWSLERIDPYAHCGGKQNWKASINPTGGTPGKINSVNQENTPTNLQIVEMEIIHPAQLKLIFNKMVDPYSATTPNTYLINNGMGAPDSATLVDLRTIMLFYSQDFMHGKHYQVQAIDIADCTGRQGTLTKELYNPDTISIRDIIINEILPDPKTEGVEFIEIYNNSEKTVDISGLYLATIGSSDGKINQKKITSESHLMYPTTYRLLSKDPDIVQSHYFSPNPDVFIKMNAFPGLTNEKGTILLLNGSTEIDRLDYQEDMHDPLIIDPKGVSLERVKFSLETNAPGNFKSAAATVGYATPGYQNSQSQEEGDALQEQIYLSSKTFSPDDDGFEDLLEINYQFPEGGKMVNIEIYNHEGGLVKHLKRNHRLGTDGAIKWGGVMDNGNRANVGIYIVLIEVYDHKGMRKLIKKSCVLASKF